MGKSLRLFVYSSGIFICFLCYSIILERITKRNYQGRSREEQEVFTCYLTIVFIQSVVNYGYANFLSKTVMKQHSENKTKTLYYWTCALTNLLATLCSTMALQWISYPLQVIGKSGKPIPVLVLGVLLGKKAYPYYKFVFVLMVVFGMTLFMWNNDEEREYLHEGGTRIGGLLIILSLAMDGVTAAIQERMRTEFMTKSLHMMSSINKWTILYLAVALAYTGEMRDFIGFVSRHPVILVEIVSFLLVNTQGQVFVFLTIEHFGALPCTLVTTTRKFITVLLSVIIFGNKLVTRQWVATMIIFTGLFLDIVWKDVYNVTIVERWSRFLQLKRSRKRQIIDRKEWV